MSCRVWLPPRCVSQPQAPSDMAMLLDVASKAGLTGVTEKTLRVCTCVSPCMCLCVRVCLLWRGVAVSIRLLSRLSLALFSLHSRAGRLATTLAPLLLCVPACAQSDPIRFDSIRFD